ncbi:YjiH family protein [Bacillus sp. B-jedd]|uniref:YjiH family protein n=1 Tax=Bacillus sp. B-jedd TaxID=1476857 RepID=UPI0005156526|nr:YjiH family protein [Bacillus sp. B-jedd]CEG28551.1 membrane protein [Bacillus sp. B-jedd]
MGTGQLEKVEPQKEKRLSLNVAKFFIFSAIGIFVFFVPITMNGKSSIMLDHIVTFISSAVPGILPYYGLVVILAGAVYPFVNKTWNKDTVTTVFSLLKVLGLITAVMLVFNIGPKWFFDPNMGPFLFNKLVIPVGMLVPIGSIFLAMLVGYGLLEFIGIFMQPVMRPIWKTPGRSAVDAVASFVGSYSIGLLITNRVFKEGKYTIKEAAIIATGFSTVSATFMIVVAKTLDLMEIWNTYFWVTFLVTFLVTAITVRIWPLSKMNDSYYENKEGDREVLVKKDRIRHAWQEAMATADTAPSLAQNIWANLKDGFIMTMGILPSIMSVGLIGLVLAEYTPLFDWLGYLFYPFIALVQLPDPLLASKASALSIAEMFLPALLVAKAALVTKFVIGVVSVSAIIFFSAVVPCILSTEIPLSIRQLVIIWFQRVVLTILLTAPLAYLLL